MKKLLLLSLTLLCAVSLSAATQTVRIKNAQSNLVQKATTTFSLNKNAQCANFMAQPINSPRLAASKTAAKRVVRHLPGVTDLRGSYVEDTPGSNDGIEYATACTSVEIRDTLVVDEETGEEYNVYIEGFCQGIASVIGQYDPEDGTILIPMQYCYYDEEDEQVQLAHIAAFTEVTEEGYNLADYLVLLVSEDENGFYVGPTIFDKVTDEMTIGRDEVFGPVLCIKRCKDFEDGKLTLEQVVEYAKTKGEPKSTSGKQELYEAIVNMYI